MSQNFLKDPELAKALVEKSSINKEDIVLEIGPGSGIITSELLTMAKKVIAVELDIKYFEQLKEELAENEKLELHNADILTFDLPSFPYKVFSNLPFRFTGEVINKLLRSNNPPLDGYLIIQKEAAEKFIRNSLVSVLYNPWYEFSILYNFNPNDFIPAPGVNVVLLQIQKRPSPLINNLERTTYLDFVAYVFSQKKPRVFRISHPTRLKLPQWVGLFNSFGEQKEYLASRVRGAANKLFDEQMDLHKIHRTRTDKRWKTFQAR